MLNYITLVLGELATNCYLVWNQSTRKTIIIDPADDGVGISEEIQRRNLNPIAILATHGHFDHVLGGLDLKLIYQIPFYCSGLDQFLLERQKETAGFYLKQDIVTPNFSKIDVDLNKIDSIELGNFRIKCIKTPGHTPGGVSFWFEEEKRVISGDVWFSDGVGETSHTYSNKSDLYKSIQILKNLPIGTKVMPGHGQSFII